MQVWMTIVVVIQILAALAMIGLVLVQHGKGADIGASFGGGSSGSLFGASGSANFLSRSTAACATLFFVCTLALAYMANSSTGAASRDSVLDRALPASQGASEPVPGQIPGAAPGQIPGAAPTVAPTSAPPAPAAETSPSPAAVPAPAGAAGEGAAGGAPASRP
jgi:preprotein translocase subunit SecG